MASRFAHIQLELAREPGHPFGDRERIYQFYLPLTEGGHIDTHLWRENAAICRVRRFRPNEVDARGVVTRDDGGRWVFSYADGADTDVQAGFRFANERFLPGEHISIREDDGKMHKFQVISVRLDSSSLQNEARRPYA